MIANDSEVQTLIDLGLTSIQARTYLGLAKFGPQKISVISKQSKVARLDIYRSLAKLQELSLVEEIVETPVKYRAVSLDKGIGSLLERRAQEYNKLRKSTQVLLQSLKEKQIPNQIQSADSSMC